MSVHTIRMPDIGEGIAEVELVDWRVTVGESVREDQTQAGQPASHGQAAISSPAATTSSSWRAQSRSESPTPPGIASYR